MTEQQRSKEFIKAAHEVIKVWPGYAAHKFPAPTNRTDQCIQCDMRFSLRLLVETWQDCRTSRATDEDFKNSLNHWMYKHLNAAEIFNIGKPEGDYAIDKKKKLKIEASRNKCMF